MGWALPFVRILLLYVRKADIEVPNHWLHVSFIRWLACYPLSSFDSIYFGWRSLRYHLNTGMRWTANKLGFCLCTNNCGNKIKIALFTKCLMKEGYRPNETDEISIVVGTEADNGWPLNEWNSINCGSFTGSFCPITLGLYLHTPYSFINILAEDSYRIVLCFMQVTN